MKPMLLPEKPHRILDFLAALEHPEIGASLETSGLTDRARDEGWALLRRYAATRLYPIRRERRGYERLDDWENRWMPVVQASLRQRYPRIHEQVMRRIGQTSGIEVVLTVSALVERIRKLEDAGAKTEQRAARALLAERGLTNAVIEEAERLINEIMRFEIPAEDEATRRREAKAAEEALWNWYIEWSAISRASITDPRLLKVLGFGAPGRPRGKKRTPDDAKPGANRRTAKK